MKRNTSILLVSTLALSACATGPHPSPTAGPGTSTQASAPLADSSVDITYVLGHTHRRFVAWARDSACLAQTFLDRQVLKESQVDSKRYEHFFDKASQLLRAPRRNPAENSASSSEVCRSPYSVTLRIGATSQTTQGCRGQDEGLLSRLVKDGEFLLYSRK